MTDQDTSPEAVGRMIAGPLTEIARSKGMPVTDDDVDACKLVAATLRALSAERDALKAKLVSTLSAAILDAQIRVVENQKLDTPNQIRANARAFIDRHQKGPSQ